MTEINIMEQLLNHNHPNIIKLIDWCILEHVMDYSSTKYAYIIMEKAIICLDKLVKFLSFDKDFELRFRTTLKRINILIKKNW
jgi:hypothetical protein